MNKGHQVKAMRFPVCRCLVFAAAFIVFVANGASHSADEKQDMAQSGSFGRLFFDLLASIGDLKLTAEIWQALEEPSLRDSRPEGEYPVLRFTHIPTFHRPSAFRIFDESGKYYLMLKMEDGAGGYDPGVLTVSRVVELNSDTFHELQRSFRDAPVCGAPPDRNRGLDGSVWIFEIAGADSYCIAQRWTPRNGVYHRLGVAVARIAEVEIPY